jgi:Domain of unknown function (DUF4224)
MDVPDLLAPPPDFVLSDAELVALTGYKQARNQAAWIREMYRIPAAVNGAGECVVVRAHLLAAATPVSGKRPQVLAVRKRRQTV